LRVGHQRQYRMMERTEGAAAMVRDGRLAGP
jgi:hypothetical protein